MMRLVKLAAAAAVFWLAATVGLWVWANTRSDEQRNVDIQAAFAPAMAVAIALDGVMVGLTGGPPEELPPDEVMRAETETAIAEVEALYDELIATHQVLQEAHTDEWEKRWAADAVTIARMDKERAVEAIELAQRGGPLDWDRTPEAVSAILATALDAAVAHKEFVQEELADARQKVQSLRSGGGGDRNPVE